MKRFSPGKLICGIITIILTLSCLLMIAIGISEIRDSASVPSYYLDEEDYISTLQQEDYMNLYDMTCRDCIPDKKLSSNIKACQAVARYYQAATLYKAYVLTGDNLAITRQVQQDILISQQIQLPYFGPSRLRQRRFFLQKQWMVFMTVIRRRIRTLKSTTACIFRRSLTRNWQW